MFFSKNFNKFENINHCFFSKKNGFSKGIYKSLNCSLGSDDNKSFVDKNLEYVSKSININRENLILMNQTHGNKVILIDKKNLKSNRFDSDALVTNLKGFALGVLTADCVPILLYDEINEIIGCVHAGWKGAFSGVIENTLKKFREINKNCKINAVIGPCIGTENYEVDEVFYKNFLSESKGNQKLFSKTEDFKFLFDLRAYVSKKLRLQGVSYIDNVNINTFKDKDNFFSYRRSQKLGEIDYGRCISTICLKT